MKKITVVLLLTFSAFLNAQNTISIDGNFDDWQNIPIAVSDTSNNVHDTDGYSEGGVPSQFINYSDVDLLEVKFTNDDKALYGYMKSAGKIGKTSSTNDGHTKAGRYYFIFTIDVDDNEITGYPLREGGYYPDSKGFDMNMEVEFYNGTFNTGHYLNHEYISEQDYNANWENDLSQGIVRLAPGTYEWYSQWVMFEDSSYVVVEDKGPVYQGIIKIAVSEDGHEAEICAPFWGFLKTPEGKNIIDVGQNIVVSASLEASGELSEEAIKLGYVPGSKSVWGSNTAESFKYFVKSNTVGVKDEMVSSDYNLYQNYPNPFNPITKIEYVIPSIKKIEKLSIDMNEQASVQLIIYDALGNAVKTLVNQNQLPGKYKVEFDGSLLSSGVYFYQLKSDQFIQTKKMLLLK